MQYIPQAPPFEMIDTLISATHEATTTQLTIQPNNIFVENNYLIEPGLIENMAQTAAAGTGFIAHQKGLEPPVGFIGAIKKLMIHSLPKVGATITTRVQFKQEVMNAHIVEAQIMHEENTITSAEFTIFLQ